MSTTWTPAAVRVPGSTSNLGAGFDCLGMAVEVWLEARLVQGSSKQNFAYSGTLEGLDPGGDLVAQELRRAGLPDDLRLELHSTIPLSRGLGSSAAAIVAARALVQLARGENLDRDAVFREACEREGHPDNAGPAVYGGLLLAVPALNSTGAADRPRPPNTHETCRVPVYPEIGVALAVPEAELETKTARALLPRQVAREVAIAQAARAAALVRGLSQGDGTLIALGMEDELAVPYRAKLIAGYQAAVAAGKGNGAYGVTISGAGSTLLALTPGEAARDVAHAMADALRQAGNPAQPLTPGINTTGIQIDPSPLGQGHR